VRIFHQLSVYACITGLFLLFCTVPTVAEEAKTGIEIMEESFQRHELYPYVYENQTMILMDSSGNRNVRKLRRFSRVETDETIKFLLVIDNPVEVRGVALLAVQPPSGAGKSGVYLPAFGKKLIANAGEARGNYFLDTDFTIEDLTPEPISDYRYKRVEDINIKKVFYYVVDAFPANKDIERATGYSYRRHFVRKDTFFLVRTDFFDRRGRFIKRQTSHDLKQVSGDMWRANMVLMEDYKKHHKSLIKINKRVFSHDYVPPEMFTEEWLQENRHIKNQKRSLSEKKSDEEVENNDLEGVEEVIGE